MPSDNPLIDLVALLTGQIAGLQSLPGMGEAFSDLSLRQITYLDAIHHLENPTPSELARRLQISKPSVTAAIDRLTEAGYIRKVQSDEDRRSYHLHLTEKGQRFADVHDQIHRTLAGYLTGGLDESEVQQLHTLAQKILHYLHGKLAL